MCFTGLRRAWTFYWHGCWTWKYSRMRYGRLVELLTANNWFRCVSWCSLCRSVVWGLGRWTIDVVLRKAGGWLTRTATPCRHFLLACNEANLMHYLSSVYWVTVPVHVSGLLVAHYQEVTMRRMVHVVCLSHTNCHICSLLPPDVELLASAKYVEV
jgi:hypothetical protein